MSGEKEYGADHVVLLHPVALDARMAQWIDVPGLSGLSMPGTGTGPTSVTTLHELADWVARQIPEPVHVVGCSLGGMVAMHLALRHPHLVRSLVLAYTTARVDSSALLRRAELTLAQGAEVLVRTTMERWFTPSALSMQPFIDSVRYALSQLTSASPEAMASTWRMIASHDVVSELSSITVPATVIAGGRDRSVPLKAAVATAHSIPGATFVQTDDPHMGCLENSQRFSAIVREHIGRISGSSGARDRHVTEVPFK